MVQLFCHIKNREKIQEVNTMEILRKIMDLNKNRYRDNGAYSEKELLALEEALDYKRRMLCPMANVED
jgi:hypothetical protein